MYYGCGSWGQEPWRRKIFLLPLYVIFFYNQTISCPCSECSIDVVRGDTNHGLVKYLSSLSKPGDRNIFRLSQYMILVYNSLSSYSCSKCTTDVVRGDTNHGVGNIILNAIIMIVFFLSMSASVKLHITKKH